MRKRNKEKKKGGRKKKQKERAKRIRRERKEKGKGKGKRKGRRKGKMEDFPALNGPSTKVGTRSAIYLWTPKTWSFNKLYKVRNFPTQFIFSLKAI